MDVCNQHSGFKSDITGLLHENSIEWGIDEENDKKNPRYIQLLKSSKKTTPWKIEHLFKIAQGLGVGPSKILIGIEKELAKKFA